MSLSVRLAGLVAVVGLFALTVVQTLVPSAVTSAATRALAFTGLPRGMQSLRGRLQLAAKAADLSKLAELSRCTHSQLNAIADWFRTAAPDDPLLVLLPPAVPGAAGALVGMPPFGANPEDAVRQALVHFGAAPRPLCPQSCLSFADWASMLLARTRVRNGTATTPSYEAAFSVSAAEAAHRGTPPRPQRVFDALVVTSVAQRVVCRELPFFDYSGF